MKCWNCGAENDLDRVQTCDRCGAPLVETHALFSKPWLLVLVAAGLAFYALFMLCVFRFHGR